MYHVRFF